MRKLALVPVVVLCAVVLAEDKPPPGRKLEGVVADGENVLQAGAEMAAQWTWEGGKAAPAGGIRTDEGGRFSHVWKKWPGSVVLLAYNAARDRGAVVTITDEASKKPLAVRLGALVKVRGSIATADPAVPLPDPVTFTVTAVEGEVEFLKVKAVKGAVAFRLPAGKYRMRWADGKFREFDREIELGGRSELDLGKIVAVPTPVANGIGKVMPPFNAAGVRGGPRGLQLADYRGKWVLVLFWGSWCNTSSTQWLPNLVEFDRRLKGRFEDYQILAYHDATAKSFEEMEEKLAKHGELHWDPRNVPFPLLLDAQEGGTVKTWGVTGEPIVFLFDPEGKLVKVERDYGMLEKELLEARKR